MVRSNRVLRRKHVRTVGLEAAAAVASQDPSPEEVTDSKQLRQEVSKAIGELPEGEATAVTLHYIGEYSYREVADGLGVPSSTVKSRLHTARKQLRKPLLTIFKEDLRDARPSRDQGFSRRVNDLVRRATLVDPEGNTITFVESTR